MTLPPPKNRTCGRVGRQRVTLAGTFPTAPPRTGRDSFDVIRLSSDSPPHLPTRYRPKTVSAIDIPPTSPSGLSGHLFPFAMWPALPTSDYYGNSVAIGLASRRRSRVPSTSNVSSVS